MISRKAPSTQKYSCSLLPHALPSELACRGWLEKDSVNNRRPASQSPRCSFLSRMAWPSVLVWAGPRARALEDCGVSQHKFWRVGPLAPHWTWNPGPVAQGHTLPAALTGRKPECIVPLSRAVGSHRPGF